MSEFTGMNHDRPMTEDEVEALKNAVLALGDPDANRVVVLPARTPTDRVLDELRAERTRQEAKWGPQNLPDGTGPDWIAPGMAYGYGRMADLVRSACDTRREDDRRIMALVLLEEVFEALAESDPVKLRAELIQVGAVAVKWAEALDRRPLVHEYGGADRLHGICRCGEGRVHPNHW